MNILCKNLLQHCECSTSLMCVNLNFSCLFISFTSFLIKDAVIYSLSRMLGSNLRVLDLTSCINITDLSVRAIANYLPSLLVLRLGWCKEISDWGLLGMVEPTDCEAKDKLVRFPVLGNKSTVTNILFYNVSFNDSHL